MSWSSACNTSIRWVLSSKPAWSDPIAMRAMRVTILGVPPPARRVRSVTIDPRTPVIIGVGQHLHHAKGLEDAMEPAALMEAAIVAAAADAGLSGPPAF